MSIGVRRFTLGIFALGSLAISAYWLIPGGVKRDFARYSVDTGRELLWREDSYGFQTATPESRGLDGERIKALSQRLAHFDTKSFLILQDGEIVHESYGYFHGPGVRYQTASLAKALVGSMVLLLAMDSGWIDLDEPASRYIAPWRDDPVRSKITVGDLANHSSGIEHARATAESSRAEGWRKEYWSDHAKRFQLALHVAPVMFSPGTRTSYSGPGYAALSYALAASLRRAPVSDLAELLRTRVMRPIGVPDHHWTIGYGRSFHQDGLSLHLFEGGGRYTARAAARVGQLIVERGVWQGEKIITSNLIDALVRGELKTSAARPEWEPLSAIGWWSNAERTWPHLPQDTLIGAGSGHQVVIVVPSYRVVAVRQGRSLGGPSWGKGYWQVLDDRLLRPLAEMIHPPASQTS